MIVGSQDKEQREDADGPLSYIYMRSMDKDKGLKSSATSTMISFN
jgi:hypothetical protein